MGKIDKMKKYDFIIGYEHKVREIESVCLLKYELERRRYSVLIYNTNDDRFKEKINKYYAKVLILPYAYDDKIISFCVGKSIKFDKIINLQWEQAIYKHQEDEKTSYRNPSGISCQAMHIAWGEANKRRLTHIVGLNEENVSVAGNMTLDFLKNPLKNFYMDRKELFFKYQIPEEKRVCLFISSFKSATLSDETLNEWCRIYGEWRREQHNVAKRTLKEILRWIEKAIQEDSNLFFVYRPHPGEHTQFVDELESKCKNFKVISDLSVKQWIIATDVVYTWMSTTVVESFFANKSCYLVYPYELPKEAMVRLFEESLSIKNYEVFKQSIYSQKINRPISADKIKPYYNTDDGMSYKKVADICEKIYKDSKYLIEEIEKKNIYNLQYRDKTIYKRCKMWFWQFRFIRAIILIFGKCFSKNKFLNKKVQDNEKYLEWKKKEMVTDEQLKMISEKIKVCLEVEYEN